MAIDWTTAIATGGASEGWGIVPAYEAITGDDVDLAGTVTGAVGLPSPGDAMGEGLDWLANQGAAAFPGQVDAVDQSVDLSFQTPYVVEQLDQADYYSGQTTDIAAGLQDLGYNAQANATYDANVAQGAALNVGQQAHETAVQGGNVLQDMGMNAYAQGMQDQAQLEALGSYLGQTGEELAGGIQTQTGQNAAGITATGDQYAAQFGGLAQQANAAGTAYNPTLDYLAADSLSTGMNAQTALTDIAGQSGYAGQQGANALTALAGQTQAAATDLYGRAAPTYTPEEQRAMLLNASGYAGDLAMLEATQGPSAAQAQFNVLQNQAMQDNLALARSGSGFGESAQAMSQAINANALAGQDAANQAAILRAQEDQAWRQRQASNLGAAAQLGLGAGQQYGEQAQFQATLEQTQANSNAQNYLQAMSLATDQTQAAAATGLQGLAQQGQLTESAANTYLASLVQSGQLTQQAADNLMRGIQTAGGFVAQGAQTALGAQQAAADLELQGSLGAAGVQQGGYDQQLGAIQAGVSAGQSGMGMGADIYQQGIDTMFQGNQLGLQAIDSFLAASGHDLQGYQTADQLLQSAMGGYAQANEQQQAALQAALDQYNQAVANEQNWEQLGITHEQAETQRQSNYFELIGALANAVGEAIPG